MNGLCCLRILYCHQVFICGVGWDLASWVRFLTEGLAVRKELANEGLYRESGEDSPISALLTRRNSTALSHT